LFAACHVTTADIGSSLVGNAHGRAASPDSASRGCTHLPALLLGPACESVAGAPPNAISVFAVVLPRYREIYDALCADEDLP
jgi:hypothetical protein